MTFDEYLAMLDVQPPGDDATEEQWVEYGETLDTLRPIHEAEEAARQAKEDRARVRSSLPEEWTDRRAHPRDLTPGMEIRFKVLPNKYLHYLIVSVTPAAATAKPLDPPGPNTWISLGTECEYRRARPESVQETVNEDGTVATLW